MCVAVLGINNNYCCVGSENSVWVRSDSAGWMDSLGELGATLGPGLV